MSHAPLTQERLKELLKYDPETGLFTKTATGQAVGWINTKGYVQITLLNKKLLASRLAWLYMRGEFPSQIIDHINRNKLDNRYANLRDCSLMQNAWNISKRKTNTSGFRGVSWSKKSSAWQSMISEGGKQRYLGLFDSAKSASEAYEARAKKRGEFHCEAA